MKSFFSAAAVIAFASAVTLDHEGQQAVRSARTQVRRPPRQARRPSPEPQRLPMPARRPEPVAAPAPEPQRLPMPARRPEPVAAPAPMAAKKAAPREIIQAPAARSDALASRAGEELAGVLTQPDADTKRTVTSIKANALMARLVEQRELASMARDLEDYFPDQKDNKMKNSWWRPTTVVKPGKTFADLGDGPAFRKDYYGKDRYLKTKGRFVRATYKKGAATRTAGYPYSRTYLETRQPARCSYGYAMPYQGCGYKY